MKDNFNNNYKVSFIDGIISEKPIINDGTFQVAFVGRSNVGKSTTLNSLFGKKNLVKTGKTPGKTKEINFFYFENSDDSVYYFVDLPGYGYAKLSKKDRLILKERIYWYIINKKSFLKLVILIIDAKVGLTDLDLEMIELLEYHKRPFILAVNKIDKINQKAKSLLNKKIKIDLIHSKYLIDILFFSAEKKKQINLLMKEILDFLKNKHSIK